MREGFCNADDIVPAAILCLANSFREQCIYNVLGLDVLVECLNKGGKSSPVKTVVALYLLVFIGIERLECLIALMMVLLSFLFPSSTRWRQSL